MTDSELYYYLRKYILSPKELYHLGYPMESSLFRDKAIIYKSPGIDQQDIQKVTVNKMDYIFSSVITVSRCTCGIWSYCVCRRNSLPYIHSTFGILQCLVKERRCVRCDSGFFVDQNGECISQEQCVYHWGKLYHRRGVTSEYTCCQGRSDSKGCSVSKSHVWTGITVGINGPLDGYVKTEVQRVPAPEGNYGVYAIDCEMCFTSAGLEVTKVSVVASDGCIVYETFVKPDNKIIDYNTRFSGISAHDLEQENGVKSLKQVQSDLMGFINADTILIGHGLENDLRALRIIHSTVVDTAMVFPHYYNLPYKRSLKSLASSYLKRKIQLVNAVGHKSHEDARACMDLMLWRVRNDFKFELEEICDRCR